CTANVTVLPLNSDLVIRKEAVGSSPLGFRELCAVKGMTGSTPQSGQKLLHDVTMHVREPEAAALEQKRQPLVIDAQEVQDRRLQIVYVYGTRRERRFVRRDRLALLIGDVVAVVIGSAVRKARLDAGPGQPD